MRRPDLHAIITHCGTESARIAPDTLTDSYIQFLPKNPFFAQFNDSDSQIHTIHFYITEIHPVLIHWWIVYAILLQPGLLHC